MLSADGANINKKPLMPLAQSDYMTNNTNNSHCGTGFAEFHPANIDFNNFIPQDQSQNCQISTSSMFQTEWNGHGHANDGSMFAEFPLSHGQYPPMSNSSYMMGTSKPSQFGCTDFESLQQKISLKKQSLDILQGVMPDPLGLDSEASQEKRAYMTSTERIQVPSSDHVAEIVGKNGQRIKQLREQLKVWVKTPSRDEPPIFEVTGLPEKLAEAKSHILRMSEHFTKVQQERMQRIEPNRIEDRLYVEQDKVGLIVGANGQTIRWVQQLSDTHIATPRKQESIPGLPPPQTYFTICGATDKVKFAKQLICEYVTLRCQGLWLDPDLEPSSEASKLVRDFHQRRQVEDTQRKTTAGPGPMNAGSVITSSAPIRSGNGTEASKYAMSTMTRGAGFDYASIGGLGDFASSSSGGGGVSAASVHQLISDMEDMWSRSGISDSATAANNINSNVAPPPPVNAMTNSMMSAVNANAWYPMSMYAGNGPVPAPAAAAANISDRRYSSAELTNASAGGANGYLGGSSMIGIGGDFAGGYVNQQQMPPMPGGPGPLQQQQQQQVPIKKSHSEEQVSPQLVGPGWM